MAQKRKSGSGTVRLRNDGRWEGRHVVGYDEKGLPKTKSVTAKTKKECVARLKKLQSEMAVAPKEEKHSPSTLFGDWMMYWYETCSKPRIRTSTQEGYESVIRLHIVPQLGEIPLNKLTANDLQQFYNQTRTSGRKRMAQHYGEGLSNRTIRIIHTVCRMALERGVTEGLLHVNPAVGCKLPPKVRQEMQVLTNEEMRRFFLQAREEGYYELFLLDIATGLRRGELLALQWDDLNVEMGALNICKQVTRVGGKLDLSQPKTKATNRTIILPKPVVDELQRYRQSSTSRWLFPSPQKEDEPLDPAWCRRKLQRILDHAQCKKVRFHDLRHTFATCALAGGMDVKTLSTVIGHMSVATTLDTYTHSTLEMQRTAAVNIDRCIAKKVDYTPVEPPKPVEPPVKFEVYKGKRRKAGTGCVSQINDHLWEGRYSPKWIDGKKKLRTVYAKTETECEILLATMIEEMKRELIELKEQLKSA